MRVLFAGPTLADKLSEIQRNDPELVIAKPVVWGDVAKAVLDGAKVIGIVDGCFEQTRAVWHKEILYALSQGVTVAGAASMGALRAAECSPFGMIGFGDVFEGYMSGELIDDSDVALVHASEEFGHHPLSEPRVNVLATLQAMYEAGLISAAELKSAKAAARRTHYAQLNYAAVLNTLPTNDVARLQRLITWAEHHRINVKQQDALMLVEWIKTADMVNSQLPVDWQFSESAQWRTLLSEIHSVRAR